MVEFATARDCGPCRGDEIGKHSGLKIRRFTACRFESGPRHQQTLQPISTVHDEAPPDKAECFKNDAFPWLGKRPVTEIDAPEIPAVLKRIDSRDVIPISARRYGMAPAGTATAGHSCKRGRTL